MSAGAFSGPDMLHEKDFTGSVNSGLPAPYPAELVRHAGRTVVAVGAGTRLLLLDPADGRSVGEPTSASGRSGSRSSRTSMATVATTPCCSAPAGAAELPRVVFDLGDGAPVCRRAMPVGDPGRMSGFEPFAPTPGDDPRFVRPLPWNAIGERPPLFPASPVGIFL